MRIKTIIATLSDLSDEQKEMDLTIYGSNTGEYFSVDEILEVCENDDVLDKGSTILTILN